MKLCPTCLRCYEDSDRACEVAGHGPLAGEREGSRAVGGKYRLDSRIGRGAMGTVYRATLVGQNEERAVKLLDPKYVVDRKARERFRNEAKTGDLFAHENVVRTFDYGELGDGQAYLAMELLNGQSLREYMQQGRQLPIDKAVDIALQAAKGVEALHEKEILHRDLKPENIMLMTDGRGKRLVKLLDFGLAKPIGGLAPAFSKTTVALKEFVGTIKYTSPENCNGEALDKRSDIYSLGVILYEMLTGRTPFDGRDDEVERQHREATPTPVERLRPDVPPALAKVVAESLNKDPKQRPQSAKELVDHLRYIVTKLDPHPAKPSPEAAVAAAASGGPGNDPQPRPETQKQPASYAGTPPQTAQAEGELGEHGVDHLFEHYLTPQPMTKATDSYTAPLRSKPGGTHHGPRLPGRGAIVVAAAALLLLLVAAGSCYVYPYYRSRQATSHFERGMTLVHLNKHVEAVAEFDAAVASDPEMAQAYLYRGLARSKTGDFARALADYDEAIRREPQNATAYQSRAEAHLASGHNDEAIADYTQLLQLSPGPEAYKMRGDAHMKVRNYERAIADYSEALARDPESLIALEARGDAYIMSGDKGRGDKDHWKAQRLRAKLRALKR